MAVEKGDYTTAIYLYSRSIHRDPTFGQTYLDRGIAYEKLGEKEKAINDFLKAIELSPGAYEQASKRRDLANEHLATLTGAPKANSTAFVQSPIQNTNSTQPKSIALDFVVPGPGCLEKVPTPRAPMNFATDGMSKHARMGDTVPW